jgi:hypothetical protein
VVELLGTRSGTAALVAASLICASGRRIAGKNLAFLGQRLDT